MHDFRKQQLKQLLDDWERLTESIDELRAFIDDWSRHSDWAISGEVNESRNLLFSYGMERKGIVRGIAIAVNHCGDKDKVYIVGDLAFSISVNCESLTVRETEAINFG